MKTVTTTLMLLTSLLLSTQAAASNKLFVGGLSWDTSSEQVKQLVEPYGPVLSVVVRNIDADGILRANSVVEYESEASVDAAVSALDGMVYDGSPLKVRKDREIVVVGSKVKEVIREAGLRSDGELVQAVSDKVYEMLDEAIERARANRRGTVRPYDL